MNLKRSLAAFTVVLLLSGCAGLSPMQKQHVLLLGVLGGIGGAAAGWAMTGGSAEATVGGAAVLGGLMMSVKGLQYQSYNYWYRNCINSGASPEYCHRKALRATRN